MMNQPLPSSESGGPIGDIAPNVRPGGGNPFPGLRPFSIDEFHLFFGREGQVDEILVKLSKNHFLTVLGYSGSGKSSLMYCGLLPVLYGGFVSQTGSDWHVVTVRPGTSPISNLAEGAVDYMIAKGSIHASDREVHIAIVGSVLRSGQYGLIEVARMIQQSTGENVFFMVDQFEEIFRFREGDLFNAAASDESHQYVNLILSAIGQRDVPVYVALTMRSDFLDKCALFPGLTSLINESNYLVPQMTREQKKAVIEGPIIVAGGIIAPRLVRRLLRDISNDQDQLPIIQHALMRTWEYWIGNREPGEPIDLRHYNAIGGITQALSLHANEAYDELTAREKEIAEILFKSITEKNQENREFRRPVKIDLLCELSGANESEVIAVADHFRRAGRSFLMPSPFVALSKDSAIELSHESLMRIWNRLAGWVEEEYESAQMYKRLSEAAAMYQIGKTGLWRPPDLQLALNWYKKQKPTLAWAQRYDEAFERAVVFLDTSRITYEAELKNLEMMQRRVLRRTRVTAIILGIAAVVAILFMVFAYMKKIEADSQTVLANRNAEAAKEQQNIAVAERYKADSARLEAQVAARKLADANKELEQALQERTAAVRRAEDALGVAQWQTQIALEAKENEAEARAIAEQKKQEAENEYNRANRLLMLTKAQAMAAKSRQENDDKDLAGLLAMQAYRFHKKYDGKQYDPYIYSGLYYALTKLDNKTYNAIKVQGAARNRINSLALTSSGTTFYSAGADGRIFIGDYLNLTNKPTQYNNAFPNKVIALSKDQRYLVNGTDSSFVQVFDLTHNTAAPAMVVSGFKGATDDLEFLPNSNTLIVASGDFLKQQYVLSSVDLPGGKITPILTLPTEIKTISVSPDGNWLAGGTWDGRVIMVNLKDGTNAQLLEEKNSRILVVKFSPDGKTLAYGTDDLVSKRGSVKLYDLGTKETKNFTGHNAGVFDIEFSPDGKLLASAGADKKLQMWVLDFPEDLPIEMDNNNGYIFDITFTRDSDYLIATTSESEIRVWPTDYSLLAVKVCPQMSRNMSPDEWSKYVGDDIEYEYTCPGALIKDYGK
jgi:WD40 repeat protein/energy-coupling factor transporter ATP-binding protein EcfA2